MKTPDPSTVARLLAEAVADVAVTDPPTTAALPLTRRVVEVLAINADGTLNVIWPDGTTVLSIPVIADALDPIVGDVVVLLGAGSDYVCIGGVVGARPGWNISGCNGQPIGPFFNHIFPGTAWILRGGVTQFGGVVTVPRDGPYRCSGTLSMTSNPGGLRAVYLFQFRSGAIIDMAHTLTPADNHETMQNVSTSFDCLKNDQIDMEVWQNSGVDQFYWDVLADLRRCRFEGSYG